MTTEQQAAETQGAEAQAPGTDEAPAAAPAPEQPADWAAFITDEGEPAEEPPTEPQEEPEQAPAAEAQSEPEPESEAEPEGEQAQQAAEPPAEQPPAQEPEAQQQQQAEAEPEPEQPDWERLRQEALQQLREEYKLDEEAARRFEADPAATLPELAAQLHVRVYDAVFASIQQLIPQMVEAVLAQRERVQSFEQRFYERWPQLREHRATVERFLQAYRMAVPNASEDELIRNVGAQAVIALQLPIEAKQQEPAAPQPPAPEPSPQAVGRERKGSRPAPTVPTPPPPVQSQTGNIWEELIHEE